MFQRKLDYVGIRVVERGRAIAQVKIPQPDEAFIELLLAHRVEFQEKRVAPECQRACVIDPNESRLTTFNPCFRAHSANTDGDGNMPPGNTYC